MALINRSIFVIKKIKFEKILSEVITKEDKIIVLYSGTTNFFSKNLTLILKIPKKIPEVILDPI